MIVLFLVVIMVWAVVLEIIDFIAMQSWSTLVPIGTQNKYGIL